MGIAAVVALGALGIKKVASNDEAKVVLQFALSFVLPDAIVESMLDSKRDVLTAISAVGAKVDLLLGRAQATSIQFLRDAIVAYEHRNYAERNHRQSGLVNQHARS